MPNMPTVWDFLRWNIVRLVCWMLGMRLWLPCLDGMDGVEGSENEDDREEIGQIERDWVRTARQRLTVRGTADPDTLTEDEWEEYLDDCWLDGLSIAIENLEGRLRANG